MIKLKPLIFVALAVSTYTANADEVIDHVPDNIMGQALGGWSSFLIGGAVGGPIGAVVGGIAGAWAGGSIQQAADASGNSYLIKSENGEVQLIRSPNYTFEIGDDVKIEGIRAIPIAKSNVGDAIALR